MKHWHGLFVSLFLGASSLFAAGEFQPPPGVEPTPVLELDFNSPWMRELIAKCPYARVEGDVLTVEVPEIKGKPMEEAVWVEVPLDLEKLGAVGRTIQVRMEATFSGVTAPGKHYLGAKGMLIVTDAETGKDERWVDGLIMGGCAGKPDDDAEYRAKNREGHDDEHVAGALSADDVPSVLHFIAGRRTDEGDHGIPFVGSIPEMVSRRIAIVPVRLNGSVTLA